MNIYYHHRIINHDNRQHTPEFRTIQKQTDRDLGIVESYFMFDFNVVVLLVLYMKKYFSKNALPEMLTAQIKVILNPRGGVISDIRYF